MLEGYRGRIRQAVIPLLVALAAIFCLTCAYYLGAINAHYTERAAYRTRHYAEHSEKRISDECTNRELAAFSKCVKEIVEATNEHQRSENDLSAQQAMADWAYWMMIVSVAGFFVGASGVVLVALILAETREAVRVTREIGQDQSRAYVHVNKAELYWGNRHAASPGVTLTVCNTGATPAKWFAISSRVIVSYWTEDGPPEDTVFASVPLPDEPFIWNAIGANAELTAPGLRAADKDELTKAIRNIVRIDALGVIRYETFFGEIFESEFWFVARGPLDWKYRDIEGGKGSVEVPHRMVRAAGRLRTYEKMKT